MKYLIINNSNCFNLIFLIEVSSLSGFRILNKFDTCGELAIDLRIYEILDYLKYSKQVIFTQI